MDAFLAAVLSALKSAGVPVSVTVGIMVMLWLGDRLFVRADKRSDSEKSYGIEERKLLSSDEKTFREVLMTQIATLRAEIDALRATLDACHGKLDEQFQVNLQLRETIMELKFEMGQHAKTIYGVSDDITAINVPDVPDVPMECRSPVTADHEKNSPPSA